MSITVYVYGLFSRFLHIKSRKKPKIQLQMTGKRRKVPIPKNHFITCAVEMFLLITSQRF
jgi:hypothetical protein